jgi:hypothetical protein
MNCPKCEKLIEKKNYCANCRIYICPRCRSYHDAKKAISWPKAVIGTILLPFALLFMLITDSSDLGYILSYEKCHYCGKRYLV